jgi:tellurite methyltransferase
VDADMNAGWDAYWRDEHNRSYWLEPHEAVVEFVKNLDKAVVKDVLDLGCGIGRHALYFVGAGFNVTAVDSSPEALEALRQQIDEKKMGIRILEGDYKYDLFPAGSFDIILAFNVLYHGYRETFDKAVRLIHKWLRPGGQLFFTCPTRRDAKYGSGEMIAPHTFCPTNSIHPGDIHYFADEVDIADFLREFREVSGNVDEHFWDNNGTRQFSSCWRITVKK